MTIAAWTTGTTATTMTTTMTMTIADPELTAVPGSRPERSKHANQLWDGAVKRHGIT